MWPRGGGGRAVLVALLVLLLAGTTRAQTVAPSAAPSAAPTTEPTTPAPTTPAPTTPAPTTPAPTTPAPTTPAPTTPAPTTRAPTTPAPTTPAPTTPAPTISAPAGPPTPLRPTTRPTTARPTTARPTRKPTNSPTVAAPSTPITAPTLKPSKPTPASAAPTGKPTAPSTAPSTAQPTAAVAVVSGLTIGSYLLSVVALVAALGALWLVMAHRASPVMLLSQPAFMLQFISGTLLMAVSLFPFVAASYAPSATVCLVHKWFFNVGFVLAIASLLVKEYRSHRVFQSTKNMVRYREDRTRLLGFTCLIEVPVVALLIVHSLLGDPGPNSDNRCGNSAFSIAVFAYEGFLAIALVIMAFIAREVPSVAGDSWGIITAASLICFAAFFTTSIVLARALVVNVETLVVTFTVTFCICVTLIIIVFKRALYLRLTQHEIVEKFLEKTQQRSQAVLRASTNLMQPLHGSGAFPPPEQGQQQQRKSFHQETELSMRRDRQTTNASTNASSQDDGLREDSQPTVPGRALPPGFGVGAGQPQAASTTASKAEGASAQSAVAPAPAAVAPAPAAAAAATITAVPLEVGAAAASTVPPHDSISSRCAPASPQAQTAPVAIPQLPPRPPTPPMAPSRGEGAAAAASADTAQARYMAKLKVMIEAKKALAFDAGTENGWEHYVDRESGAEWWLNAATLEIMSEDPASDPGSRGSQRILSVD